MQPISPRQSDILVLARDRGRVAVEDLALRYEVTQQTIRKDLNELCERRLMSRVHGGAILSSGVENVAYDARRSIAQEAKRAIGEVAASLIPNNASLFINIGTTTEEVARALSGHEGLLVITNNLNVANLLYRHPRMEVIVAGGPVRRADGAVIGAAAVEFVRQFKVDYAVIGTSALDGEGALLDFDVREVQVARAIIENARQVMLVADRSKWERAAPVRIGHLADIDVFVTDRPTPAALGALAEANAVRLVEVGETDDGNEAGQHPEARGSSSSDGSG